MLVCQPEIAMKSIITALLLKLAGLGLLGFVALRIVLAKGRPSAQGQRGHFVSCSNRNLI